MTEKERKSAFKMLWSKSFLSILTGITALVNQMYKSTSVSVSQWNLSAQVDSLLCIPQVEINQD